MNADDELEAILERDFPLQEVLEEALGDPIGDLLEEIEPEAFLRLFEGHDISVLRNFMRHFYVPARRPDLNTARRILGNLRRAKHEERNKAVGFLTRPLTNKVLPALTATSGREDAAPPDVDLPELVDEYGLPAVVLTVLGDWGKTSCDYFAGLLILDRRAVPVRWRPHLDRLESVARFYCDAFKEVLEDKKEGEVFEGASERTFAPVDSDSAFNLAFGAAEADAIEALEQRDAAIQRFEETVRSLRLLVDRPAARFLDLEVLSDLMSDEDVMALREYAAASLDAEDDTSSLQFLAALAELSDLVNLEASDIEVMAAEQRVRGFTESGVFSSAVFAALRGRLRLAPLGTVVDPRLASHMDAAVSVSASARAASAAEEGTVEEPADAHGEPDDPNDLTSAAEAQEPVGEPAVASGSEAAASLDSESTLEPATVTVDEAPTTPEVVPPADEQLATQEAPREPDATSGSVADEEEIRRYFGTLLGECRWSLAYWLALAVGSGQRMSGLEAVAYADGARSATSPLALELTSVVDRLSTHQLGGDKAMLLVATAAATRAALVAPYSGIAGVLPALANAFEEEAPAIAGLANAAAEAAKQGVAFTGDLATRLGGAAETDAALGDIVARADNMLTRTGRTGYSRADHIWTDWVGEGGSVHDLLAAVSADDLEHVDAVRDAVFRYGKESAQSQQLRDYDERYRGPGKQHLEGSARRTLVERLHDAVHIASTWLDLRTQVSNTIDDHQAAVARRLNEAVRRNRGSLESYLSKLAAGDDPEVAGAALGALRLYQGSFDLLSGTALPGEEVEKSTLLDAPLLLTKIPLNPDLQPARPEAITAKDVLGAGERTWADAFDSRCEAGDHIATKAIVDVVNAINPVLGKEFAERRLGELTKAHERILKRVEQLEGRIESARRAGRLIEDRADDLFLSLERAKGRDDVAVVESELAEVESRLSEEAETAIATFRVRLAEEVANNQVVARSRERLEGLLDEGDVATAEELLLQMLEGADQAEEHRPEVDFASFFPAVPEYLRSGIDEALVRCASERGVSGPLDFSILSPEAARTAAAALEAWRKVSVGERTANKGDALAPALAALGVEFGRERPSKLPASNDRTWMDLHDVVRAGESLVPAFGSRAGKELRFLLVWKQPGESFLQWIEQDPSERCVIVLYFGVMSNELRCRIANKLRRGFSRPVVVVDDAVVAWAVSLNRQSFDVTMRATLPFSVENPYIPDVAGAVPEEMFYGRLDERSAVTSVVGTSLMYGGRRLGKSALLRSAARRFEQGQQVQRAIYIDIAASAAGARDRPAAVWDLIFSQLVKIGIAKRPESARRTTNDPFAVTEAAIRSYLALGEERRILLLLDESDDFFDADAKSDFRETRRLKELMESTERRFKVVFAGLHQVARFASYPNQPLAHLGRPLPIGPLAAQPAHNLIAKPFLVLGWRFASEDLISRVLAYCNYTPILLQEFGHQLLNHLYSRPLEELTPPAVITHEDIDSVLSRGELAHAIQSRFNLTLSLDPRYKMIAYVLALETIDAKRGSQVSYSAPDLLDHCRGWWEDGFAKVNIDEFRALLEELVGLGVLSADRGTWRMRSPNVQRLLGSKANIERGLAELVVENPTPGGFFSSDAHRLVESAEHAAGGHLRSPFTEQQLADVIGEGHNRLRFVVGSDATKADTIGPVLEACSTLMGRWDFRQSTTRGQFEEFVASVPARGHRVVLADLRSVREESLLRSITASARRPTERGATCSVILVIEPKTLPLAKLTLQQVGHEDADVVPLRRYSAAGLAAWAVENEASVFSEDQRGRMLEVTGGWPVLVEEVATSLASAGPIRAVEKLATAMPERSSALIGEIGIDDSGLAAAYDSALVLLDDSSAPAEDVAAVIHEDAEQGLLLVQSLWAAGVLDEEDGLLSLEPVSAAAWRRRSADASTHG